MHARVRRLLHVWVLCLAMSVGSDCIVFGHHVCALPCNPSPQGAGVRLGGDDDSSSDDEEGGGGKLSALARVRLSDRGGPTASTHLQRAQQPDPSHQYVQQHQHGGVIDGRGGVGDSGGPESRKVLTAEQRQRELLAMPQAELSKWQRKRQRQKAKRNVAAPQEQTVRQHM
jgi:hypothetical protein